MAESQDVSDPFGAYQARRYFGHLDGLRCLSIFMVLWHHNPPVSPELLTLFGRGFLGVNFFFILSGFLITTLLLREADAFGRISLRDFYLRRAVRILPVYVFVVTLVGAYYIFAKGQRELLDIWLYYYLFLSSYLLEHIPLLTITWSLAIEEQYYLIWPLILMLVPVRWLWLVCVAIIVVNVAGAVGAYARTEIVMGPVNIYLPNRAFTPIVMGSLAAILLHHRSGFRLLHQIFGGNWAAPAGLIGLGVVLQITPQDIQGWPTFYIHLVMVALLIALVVREQTALSGLLRHPVIVRLGVISYGIYLYHLIALTLVTKAAGVLFGGMPPWVIFVIYGLFSVLMAEISFRTLERWFLRFRPAPRARP